MEKEPMLNMDKEQNLFEDAHLKEGKEEYERIMECSMNISERITSTLVNEITKKNEIGEKENSITLTMAIMATAKTLINLVSYAYDTEEELTTMIHKTREAVIERVIPSLLNSKACGNCSECKSGQPCSCPDIDVELLDSKVLPILCAEILEYDLWNKTMYMYTEGRKLLNQDGTGNDSK